MNPFINGRGPPFGFPHLWCRGRKCSPKENHNLNIRQTDLFDFFIFFQGAQGNVLHVVFEIRHLLSFCLAQQCFLLLWFWKTQFCNVIDFQLSLGGLRSRLDCGKNCLSLVCFAVTTCIAMAMIKLESIRPLRLTSQHCKFDCKSTTLWESGIAWLIWNKRPWLRKQWGVESAVIEEASCPRRPSESDRSHLLVWCLFVPPTTYT